MVKAEVAPKTDTITSPYTGGDVSVYRPLIPGFLDSLRRLTPNRKFKKFWKKVDGKWVLRRPLWKSFHTTSKKGPSGPAFASCMSDFNGIITNESSLYDSICVLGGPSLELAMDRLLSELEIINQY